MNAATATKGFCLCLVLNNTSLSIQTRNLLNVTTVINATMIKQHELIHTDKKPFKCDNCDKRYNDKTTRAYPYRQETF